MAKEEIISGSFQIVLQTKNVSAREAISLALEQMKRIQQQLVSQQELERAKEYLRQFPFATRYAKRVGGFFGPNGVLRSRLGLS